MKNQVFTLFFTGLLFSACAVGPQTGASNYQAAIYSRPMNNAQQVLTETDKQLSELQAKTLAQYKDAEVVYLNPNDVTEVLVQPGETYILLEDGDSYERRLQMFEDPRYVVSLEIDMGWNQWTDPWYNPWYGYGYYGGYYNPWRSYWGNPWYSYGWANPWWGYDPWYYGYNPYYGYCYGGYYPYYPYYGGGGGSYYGGGRDHYYGKRDDHRTYNYGHIAGNDRPQGGQSGSSYRRRDANVQQVSGQNTHQVNKTSTEAQNNNIRNNNGTTYRRGGSTGGQSAAFNSSVVNTGNNVNRTSGQTMYRRTAGAQNTTASPQDVRTMNSSDTKNTQQYTRPSSAPKSFYSTSGAKTPSQPVVNSSTTHNQNNAGSNTRSYSSPGRSSSTSSSSSAQSSGGVTRSSGSNSSGNSSSGSSSSAGSSSSGSSSNSSSGSSSSGSAHRR